MVGRVEEGVSCNVWVMSGRERVASHRERMRAQGYRPVQVWVPDVRTPEFAAAAHRASLAIAHADATRDDQDFVDAVSELWQPVDGDDW